MSNNQKKYLKKLRFEKISIILIQISIVIIFFLTWEILSSKRIINPFIFSKPSTIYKTIINLYNNFNLKNHIFTTLYEIVIAFFLGIFLGFVILFSTSTNI